MKKKYYLNSWYLISLHSYPESTKEANVVEIKITSFHIPPNSTLQTYMKIYIKKPKFKGIEVNVKVDLPGIHLLRDQRVCGQEDLFLSTKQWRL